ncbi:hypothetical protein M3Y97_00162900 [Aphelenchoides bicaudatus]|nr:hypothetical protein M3Y97_00162900 [Aphelenchoides bicaudatus]
MESTKVANGHPVHLHEVKFDNYNQHCCFRAAPIRLGISYIICIGIAISAAAITLGAIITNYTLIVAYALVLLFHIVLMAGYFHDSPKCYIVYVIGNWAMAFISLLLFGLAWMMYWIDNNRWIKHEDSQVWRWSGLPFGLDNRWWILAFSIAFILNYPIQHFFLFIICSSMLDNYAEGTVLVANYRGNDRMTNWPKMKIIHQPIPEEYNILSEEFIQTFQ